MSKEFREFYCGKEETALMEEEFLYNGERYFTGYTKEYVKVAVKSRENLENQFITGKIDRQLTDDIYLMVEF